MLVIARRRPSRRERGASMVIVTACMTVLLATAALAIDYGALVGNRLGLQGATDTAALSLAMACARGAAACDSPSDSAEREVRLIARDADTTASVSAPYRTVRVTSRTTTSTPLAVFARGSAQTSVSASATATWSSRIPVYSARALPFGIDACAWQKHNSSTGDGAVASYLFATPTLIYGDRVDCSLPADLTGTGQPATGAGLSHQMLWLTNDDLLSSDCSIAFAPDHASLQRFGDLTWEQIPPDGWIIVKHRSCTQAATGSLSTGSTVLMPIVTVVPINDNILCQQWHWLNKSLPLLSWGLDLTPCASPYRVIGYAPFTITGFVASNYHSDSGAGTCSTPTHVIDPPCTGLTGRFVTSGRRFNGFSYAEPGSSSALGMADLGNLAATATLAH